MRPAPHNLSPEGIAKHEKRERMRAYLAGMALQGLLAATANNNEQSHITTTAGKAVKLADALIAKLEEL